MWPSTGLRREVCGYDFQISVLSIFFSYVAVFLFWEKLGDPGEPGGTQKLKKQKNTDFFLRFFVDVYVGNKSALFDHQNLSIDWFKG